MQPEFIISIDGNKIEIIIDLIGIIEEFASKVQNILFFLFVDLVSNEQIPRASEWNGKKSMAHETMRIKKKNATNKMLRKCD